MSLQLIIKLRFFASVREKLNCSEETVLLPPEVTTVGQVRQWLIARGGVWADALGQSQNLRMAYQLDVCDAEKKIANGHEIAFFPPVTGG